MQHQQQKHYELEDIILLKVGRHLRPRPHFKMIIGREEGENNFLKAYRKTYPSMQAKDVNGPLVLLSGHLNKEDYKLAAEITARFGGGKHADKLIVEVSCPGQDDWLEEVVPMPIDAVAKEWYLQ